MRAISERGGLALGFIGRTEPSAPSRQGAEVPYIQTFSLVTSDHQAVVDLLQAWSAGEGPAADGFQELWLMRDHQHPDRYLLCAEFSAYEQAMASSVHPASGSLARDLARLAGDAVQARGYQLGTVVEPRA
jgi:hypothetical protein